MIFLIFIPALQSTARTLTIDVSGQPGFSFSRYTAFFQDPISVSNLLFTFQVTLITLAGRPRADAKENYSVRPGGGAPADYGFEAPFRPSIVNMYAMVAMRHMHEFGTTSAQLAWVKVAASHHAQHTPHAPLRDPGTVGGPSLITT